jgi:hypothetical protein
MSSALVERITSGIRPSDRPAIMVDLLYAA